MTTRAVKTGRAASVRLVLVVGALVVASGAAWRAELLAAESPAVAPTRAAPAGANLQTETASPTEGAKFIADTVAQ